MADHSSPGPSNLPPKRLRLGTKSCSECRRRKVRCVFKQGVMTCDGCLVHDVVCQPQKGAPRPTNSRETTAGNDRAPSAHDVTEMLQSHNVTVPIIRSTIADSVEFQSQTVPLSENRAPSEISADQGPPASNALHTSNNDVGDADPNNAPLPQLLQNHAFMTPLLSSNPRPTLSIHIPRPPLPTLATLKSLLSYSEKYWPIWPTIAFDVARLQQFILSQHEFNSHALTTDMNSHERLAIAKLYLWIALCLVHCPRRHIDSLTLPEIKKDLIARYTDYASMVLSINIDGNGGEEEVECLSILWKIAFDTGKPNRAWRYLRQGITRAIQLGYHRQDVHFDERKTAIWTALWQHERRISCMLGLPSCTSKEHAGTRLQDLPQNDATFAAHHRLSVIEGEIVKRDQTGAKNDYALTIQIDQDLESIRPLLPFLSAQSDLVTIYTAVGVKIRFHDTQKLLHVPCILREDISTLSRYSFDRVVDACREIIHTLTFLREVCDEYMCEVLDFQLFSAAMTLIIGILSHRRESTTSSSPSSIDETSDWNLVDSSLKCLRSTVERLDCSVAKQGADTLDAIIAVCHHRRLPDQQPSLENDSLVVTVPYFGCFRINFPDSSSSAFPQSTRQPHASSVEFSMVDPLPSALTSSAAWPYEDELVSDWFYQGRHNQPYDENYDFEWQFDV
ncbi:hypothetical protein DM02DRAFT_689396 [Periconia macrospinosa]|uniref:Zn(2)-C6 fungal-type domain-containing protein n=1 Tax=Periconia macrospinosa TaxID=97972 RepID=A0A2V1DCC6_9PLEO|nr:hypothetical protein DM02DRAFT_689396 [Periconia macrospinosa]